MLNLRALHQFVVLAERLNFSRAADELGITQPTLSRSIQALEVRLGLRLFDRGRGGVHLTPAGVRTAARARSLLIDAEDFEQHSRDAADGASGMVRFGMTPMPAHALLHTILSRRLTDFPAVTNEVVVRDVEALWGMLLGGEIEFFVSPDPPLHDLSATTVEVLTRFPLSLLVRPGHPLTIEPRTTQRFPLVRSSWAGLEIPEAIAHLIIGPPNIIEDFGVLEKLTATTTAMWLSTVLAVQRQVQDGRLVEIFRAEHSVSLRVYSLKRRSVSPVAEALRRELRAAVHVIAPDSHEPAEPFEQPRRARHRSRKVSQN